MKNGQYEAARKLLQRSFQSLPERKRKSFKNALFGLALFKYLTKIKIEFFSMFWAFLEN